MEVNESYCCIVDCEIRGFYTPRGNMTEKQVRWALAHDWCIAAQSGGVWVRSVERDAQGRFLTDKLYFGDYRELRAWAGY